MAITFRKVPGVDTWNFYYKSEEKMFCLLRVEVEEGRWEFFAHAEKPEEPPVWVMSISRVQSEFKNQAPSAWELLELLHGYAVWRGLPSGIPEPYREQLTKFLTDWAEAAEVST